DHPQAPRIEGLTQRHEAHARGSRRLDLALGVGPRADGRRPARTAPAGQAGEGGECGLRAAELIDQGPEGPRPDIVAANEPPPVEPLLIGQADSATTFAHAHAAPRSPWPILRSVPARSRAILARCMI